jgi:hypothetical protein
MATDFRLLIDASGIPLFLPLLEKGVFLPVRTGCSVRDFFCGQLGLDEDYLDQRIQTLFLNARPVDDVDTAMIGNDATLALSAAMPGLLGATMRKGGWYAAFRKDISQEKDSCDLTEMDGRVKIKLFNMVAKEMGIDILAKGVGVDGDDLVRIADRHPDSLVRSIKRLWIDGQPADLYPSSFLTLAGRPINLTINVEQEE